MNKYSLRLESLYEKFMDELCRVNVIGIYMVNVWLFSYIAAI